MKNKKLNFTGNTLGIILMLLGMFFAIMGNSKNAFATDWDEQGASVRLGPGAGLYHDAKHGPVCWQ